MSLPVPDEAPSIQGLTASQIEVFNCLRRIFLRFQKRHFDFWRQREIHIDHGGPELQCALDTLGFCGAGYQRLSQHAIDWSRNDGRYPRRVSSLFGTQSKFSLWWKPPLDPEG